MPRRGGHRGLITKTKRQRQRRGRAKESREMKQAVALASLRDRRQ